MIQNKILPFHRKLVKMVELADSVVNRNIEYTIDAMLQEDPRLLSRLNLRSPKIQSIIKKKVEEGQLHPFDLMFEDDETYTLEGVSRTHYDSIYKLTPEDAQWLEELTGRFKKQTESFQKTQKTKKQKRERRLDESRDDLMALA